MTTSAEQTPLPSLSFLVLWIGRVVAGGSIYVGLVALTTVGEVGSNQLVMKVSIGLLGLLGGLLFFFGLERPAHRLSILARALGWVMMAGFAMFPGDGLVPARAVGSDRPPAVFLDRRPG